MATQRQPVQQADTPDTVRGALKDESLLSFIHFYLSKRYESLIMHGVSVFASAEDFVAQMLEHLATEGPISTQEKFLGGPMALLFREMEAGTEGRRFDFDARVFLSLLSSLPPGSAVLDFGAGSNAFLPAMARRAARWDIRYYATDYYVGRGEARDSGDVKFVPQPSPVELPDVGPFDLVLLRRVAHHIPDFRSVGDEIRRNLKKNGLLVLIEDSYDDNDPSVALDVVPLVDMELTERFYRCLNDTQRIEFLRFNDWYSNHVYHKWTTMPLPMTHRTFHQWENTLAELGMKMDGAYNLGFPLNSLNLHQAATGVLVFRKEF